MALIHEIRVKLEKRLYEFSKHAVDQSIIRDISVAELEEAMAGRSELIEKTTRKTNMARAVLLWATLKRADHCTFSAATLGGHLSRSSHFTGLTLIYG